MGDKDQKLDNSGVEDEWNRLTRKDLATDQLWESESSFYYMKSK